MKEKQKGIEPLNVLVICMGIMVLVAAILNGCIKANAEGLKALNTRQGSPNIYSDVDNGYWYRDIRFNVVGNRVCVYRYNAVDRVDTVGTHYTTYDYRIYSDYGSTYSTNVTRTEYLKGIGQSEFESTTNYFEVQVVPQLVENTNNVYIHSIGMGNTSCTGVPMFDNVNSCINYINTGNTEGDINHIPVNIYDSEMPTPDIVYEKNNLWLTDTIVYLNRENYKVGIQVRWNYAVGKECNKITDKLLYRHSYTEIKSTPWRSIKSINDEYIPTDNKSKIDSKEVMDRFGNEYIEEWYNETTNMPTIQRLYYTNTYNKWQSVDGLNNNAFWSSEVMVYYYYKDSNGDTHISPTTVIKKDIPAYVDIAFSGEIQKWDNTYTITSNIDLDDRNDIVENDKPIKNETTTTNRVDIIPSKIDTDINNSIDMVSKTIKGLLNAIGDVPVFFGKIFTFFPEWLLNLIYVSLGISIIVGIIKILRG